MGTTTRERLKHHSPQWRSYGECGILCMLRKNYPTLEFIPNDRSQLDGYEMDIWIPSLKVGIEYNGQHHFKPVYGEKVFEQTKKADRAKSEIARGKNIRLVYVIPNGTIHKTAKGKLKTLFLKCCEDIGLPPPTILKIDPEEILSEQAK